MDVIALFLNYVLLLYCKVCHGATYEKVVPPLHVDLEQNFMTTFWTSSVMQCSLRCSYTAGCESFLYSNQACYNESSHLLYRGFHTTTFSGKPCQDWASQFPHKHNYTDADFPDGSASAARNYCRDPGDKSFLWCYTTDPAQEWEPCDIPSCNEDYSDGYCMEAPWTWWYTGNTSFTVNGRQCQRWDQKTPHSHAYMLNSIYADGSASDAQNYCRDHYLVTGFALWCFTMDPDVIWESCDVKHCRDIIPLERCYDTSDHYGYTGTWNHTITGILCQRWDAQTPHSHGDVDVTNFPDDTLADAANYCRDPDGTGFLWCYTTNSTYRRQPCGISKCTNHIPCRSYNNTVYYLGNHARTYTGKTCQRWDSQSPHSHPYDTEDDFREWYIESAANYCRDPSKSGRLWCYTTDPSTPSEPCDIARCLTEKGNCLLFNSSAPSADPPGIREGLLYYRRID